MKNKIGIIGCGNMGEAILAQSTKVSKAQKFIIFEKDRLKQAFACKTYRVKAAKDIIDLVYQSNIIIIAVKPQDIDVVLEQIRQGIDIFKKSRLLIISIAAGINTKYIEKRISGKAKVVRAMPNTPAAIGKGITALTKGHFATDRDLRVAERIFKTVGETIIINKEGLIDVVTALSGSGPAYVFFIINSMLAAARGLGLDRKNANKLIYYTIVGATELHKQKGFDAERLISQVTSRGGTTEAALKVFNDKNLGGIIIDAMVTAHKRAKELYLR